MANNKKGQNRNQKRSQRKNNNNNNNGKRNRNRQRKNTMPSYLQTILKYGKMALPFASKLAGFGDYTTPKTQFEQNSLFKNGNYQFDKTPFIFQHREFICDIISGAPGTFDYQTWQLNPGLQDTFPWLSNVAPNFESYKLRGLVFEFKSMSADALNSTNTALGSVIMSVQYDPTAKPFTYKQQQEQYDGAVSVKPSQSVLFGVECKRSMTMLDQYYVRSGSIPAGAALQMYDLGQFQVSTVGMQGANVNLGELWVTYDIEFIHQKLNPLEDLNVALYTSDLLPSGFGTPTLFNKEFAKTDIRITSGKLHLQGTQPGDYLFVVQGKASAGLSLPSVLATYTRCEPLYYLNDLSNQIVFDASSGVNANQSIMMTIRVTDFDAIIDLSGMTWTGSWDSPKSYMLCPLDV